MQKLASIQVLRAAAVMAVLVGHTSDTALGAAGVDLFFVISGFIMGIVSAGRTPAEFLKARARRIYPLYWVCTAPVAYAVWQSLTPSELVATLTLWPVYAGLALPALPPAWSLCFEMMFYAGCGLALATNAKLPLLVFAACFAANFLGGGLLFQFVGSPMVLEFLGGMALTRIPRHVRLSKVLFVGAILMFALSPAPAIHLAEVAIGDAFTALSRVLWWGIPSMAVVYAALCHSALFERSIFTPAVFVGDASYSVYLSHVIPNNLFMFWWPVQTALLMAVGIATYLLVERVLLRPQLRHPVIGLGPAVRNCTHSTSRRMAGHRCDGPSAAPFHH